MAIQSGINLFKENGYGLILADIGNSRIKYRTMPLNGSEKSGAVEYKPGWVSDFSVNSEIIPFDKNIFLYSAVSNKRLDDIKKAHRGCDMSFTDIMDFLKKEDLFRYKHIQGIGTDRLAGLAGALYYSEPPLITVDCGTAVTVNSVNKKKSCIGGAIFAGLQTQLKALNSYAEALPKIGLKLPTGAAGKNTADAMRSGIVSSVAGGIKELVNKIITENGFDKDVPVILTGGGAKVVFKEINKTFQGAILNKNLVLDGIEYIASLYSGELIKGPATAI